MFASIFTSLLFMLSASMAIMWHLPLLATRLFGMSLYKVTNQQTIVLALKKINKKRVSIIEDADKPKGWIWGYGGKEKYVGYIVDVAAQGMKGSPTTEIYILTTHVFYKSITEHNDSSSGNGETDTTDKDSGDKKNDKIIIDIYDRTGHYFYLSYVKRKFNVSKFIARDNQVVAINSIIDIYKRLSHAVVLIDGEPGAGKSMIPLLIAKQLGASLTDSFNPTEPGDTLISLYNTVCPSETAPLIVVLEEYDMTITRIHSGIKPHNDIPISVYDKTTWNTLMDKIDRGMFPHLIVILTSNKPKSFIDALDPSYIREGRVNLYFNVAK